MTQPDDLDQERRLIKVEGTVAWMRWCWMTLGSAAAVSGAGYLFSRL
jgi:hypothetical protein